MTIHYQQWHGIKTPSDLKLAYQDGNGGHFFDRKTLQFFGDTMKNYGIRRHTVQGRGLVFELVRKHPVKHGLQDSTYFYTEGDNRNSLSVKHTKNRDIIGN